MSEQNNNFPQQPEYIDPQQFYQAPAAPTPAQTPFGQPQYFAAPAPASQPAPAEPEVIIQEIGFADYGFGEDDSVGGGHDFGGFMEDDNKPADVLDGFNAFNSQTPNFDISAVEAASTAATAEEKAMFTSTTVNFSLEDVEKASHETSDEDRDIFSDSTAVGFKETTVSENPSFDAASAMFNKPAEPAPVVDAAPPVFTVSISEEPEEPAPVAPGSFLASMQGAFAALSGTPVAPAAPAAPAPVVETPTPAVVAEAPIPAPTSTPIEPAFEEAVPKEEPVNADPVVEASEPDIIIGKIAPSETIQDISSTTPPEEKNQEYWDNIDKMLDNFDDGKHHQNIAEPAAPAQPVAAPFMAGAPAFNAAPAEPDALINQPSEKAEEEEEAKSRFPFSESAQDVKQAPVAPAPVPIATTPAPVAAPSANTVIPQYSYTAAYAAPAAAINQPAPILLEKKEEPGEEVDEKARLKAERRAERDAKREAKREQKKQEQEKKKAEAAKKAEELDIPTGFKGIIYRVFPNKDDKIFEKVRKIIAFVSALVLIGCAIYFGVTFIGSKVQQSNNKKISDIMTDGESTSKEWNEIYEKYPDITFPSGMQIKFAELYAINQDLVGWIRIPGLEIDYPVVQGEDDEYYLHHNFENEKSDYGAIFMTCKNDVEPLDKNTVLYGHCMRRDNLMFARLHEYKTTEGLLANPIIEFNTLYHDYKYKVYCVFITNGDSSGDNGYLFLFTTPFKPGYEFTNYASFIAEINTRRLYTTGVDILEDDDILTLTTCTYEFTNARLVVIGRKLRDGEDETIDASKVEYCSNPKYPQAWYDKNKKTNPYADYAQWKPAQ